MKDFIARVSWPCVLIAGLVGSHVAFQSDHPTIAFSLVYAAAVCLLVALERYIPYEPRWALPDGETSANIAHTILTKGLVQLVALIAAIFPVLAVNMLQPDTRLDLQIWPTSWPMFVQVALALVIVEFGLYWSHRIAHERLFFWRFHALHHSVTRLWVINTGRFHVADALFKVAVSQLPLYFLGAPLQVFWWVAAVTAFMGILTHCNADMKTGFLDAIFSTPRIHRWHHSKNMREGNTNYSENIVIFDHLFGTYFNPDRAPSSDIGITGQIAKGFLRQLIQPFRKTGVAQIIGRQSRGC